MDFFSDQKWFDLAFEKYGIGYAKSMTRFLYEGVVPDEKMNDPSGRDWSDEWPNFGRIMQFNPVLTFSGAAGTGLVAGESQTLTLRTNNHNWMLISRAALNLDATLADAGLAGVHVGCTVDPNDQLMEMQPASLVFGDGRWPSILLMPEKWPMITFRRWVVANNSGAACTVRLNFAFLQVCEI